MTLERRTFPFKSIIGGVVYKEGEIEAEIYSSPPRFEDGITMLTPTRDVPAALQLSLLSWAKTEEWKNFSSALFIDDGSKDDRNFELACAFVRDYTGGTAIKLLGELRGPGQVYDLAALNGLVKTELVYSCDSDVEVRRKGMFEIMRPHFEDANVSAVGIYLDSVNWFWECTKTMMFRPRAIKPDGSLWRTKDWVLGATTFGASVGHWPIGGGVYQDALSAMTVGLEGLGKRFVHLDTEYWVYHFGGVAHGVSVGQSHRLKLYSAIMNRLLIHGVIPVDDINNYPVGTQH